MNVLSKLLRAPKPKTRYAMNGRHLALYRERSEVDYWQAYWDPTTREAAIKAGRNGDLGALEGLLTRHLPTSGRILEAGCGPARFVAALRTRGYDTEGVDAEPRVVQFVNDHAPELSVRVGDVLALDLPEGCLSGYVSLGVLEHFPEGPSAGIREARRVLKSGGTAVFSVPLLNTLRAALLGGVPAALSPKWDFYQHYFTDQEIRRELKTAGFAVVETMGYGQETFLTREVAPLKFVNEARFTPQRVRRRLKLGLRHTSAETALRYGHMIAFACRAE